MVDLLYAETGIPGAVVSVEELDGVLIERNGAGSVVARAYPGEWDYKETADERVARLSAELKDAKAYQRAQRQAAAGGAS
jgi:hypothetical protein